MDFSALSQQLSTQPIAAFFVVFAGGVATSLTPCIYPMIPITIAIIGGQEVGGTKQSRLRPIGLTLLYVLGLAATYAGLGLFAGLSGTMFGTVSTNPWLYFALANVLMLAGLAMLDVIPVPVPAALMQRAATAGTAGRASGAFIMGAMSGLVAAPCGAPVFAAILTWVSTTRSALLGFVYLFAFSVGMSAILILAGIFSGTVARLPKAGIWMLWVKKAFAIVMFGVAEYYLVKMGQLLF